MREVNLAFMRQPIDWKPGGPGALISSGLMGKGAQKLLLQGSARGAKGML